MADRHPIFSFNTQALALRAYRSREVDTATWGLALAANRGYTGATIFRSLAERAVSADEPATAADLRAMADIFEAHALPGDWPGLGRDQARHLGYTV